MSSNFTNDLVTTVYNSRGILLNLMERQGYDVGAYKGFSVHEIHTLLEYPAQLNMLFDKKLDENGEATIDMSQEPKTYIHHHFHQQLKMTVIHELVERLLYVEQIMDKKDTLFIVAKDEPNDTIRAGLRHLWENDGVFVIVQKIERLKYNVLDHKLVPKHRVLNSMELERIRKRYNISHDGQFQEIARFDPVAIAIGIRPGQVCEITRPSKTAIVSYNYRICV